MTPIRLIILAVAAGAAMLAGYMVFQLSQAPEPVAPVQVAAPPPPPQIPTVQVLTAMQDMPVGTLITPEHLTWAEWPEATVTERYIVESLHPAAFEEATGWVVRAKFFEGEPLVREKVVVKGETGYMAALLGEGKRAVSIPISVETASAGFILPNDRVDGLLTYDARYSLPDGQTTTQRETRTIFENVRVLSIDQKITYDPQTGQQAILGSTALLELSPEDAELITHAEQLGPIT
ncbi:MAG: Flp pilus assembly protein CpaB, partial [Pseudomonadota bacterium]